VLTPWEADLRATLDLMPRRVRAELLRALRLQPGALDEEIARCQADPETRAWAGTLGELREEPAAMLTVREMLERGLARRGAPA
jgi:hypothetical protein